MAQESLPMPATKTVAVEPEVHALIEDYRAKGETKGQAIERAIRTATAALQKTTTPRRAKAEG